MSLAVLTFVLVFAIFGGLYWLFVGRAEAEDQAVLRKRLRKAAMPGRLTTTLLKDPSRLDDIGGDSVLRTRSGRFLRPLERIVSQSGLNTTVGVVLGACLATSGIAFALVWMYMGLPLVAGVAAFLAAWLPIMFVRFKRSRRMLKFEEQFPEAIDLLARALRAGHALTTGLSMVAEELPDPIGPEFKLLFDQQNFGLPLPQALKAFAERIPTIDARFFVTAVLTQREAGGNLSEVLDNLASIIRDRFKVKRQVRVISAHGRITGWILSALPTTLALFFAATSPEKYASFYRDPFGLQLILGALLLQLVGVFVIRKIVQIEY